MTQEEKIKQIIKEYNLYTRSREVKYAWRRHYISLYLRKLGYTYNAIAKYLKRDHATAMNSVRQARNFEEYKDEEYERIIYPLYLDLVGADLTPVFKKSEEVRDNVFVTLINRIFEARSMEDVESIKAFINENINPSKLK